VQQLFLRVAQTQQLAWLDLTQLYPRIQVAEHLQQLLQLVEVVVKQVDPERRAVVPAAADNTQLEEQQLLGREMLVVQEALEVLMVLLIGGQAAVVVPDLSEAMAQVVGTVDLVEPAQSGCLPLQQQ
jgi:hypothetical protein